jgi:hypothetical protein
MDEQARSQPRLFGCLQPGTDDQMMLAGQTALRSSGLFTRSSSSDAVYSR